MGRFKICLLGSIFFASVALSAALASAQTPELINFKDDAQKLVEQVAITFGTMKAAPAFTSPHLKVFIWNIHKAKDIFLPSDFELTSEATDIALFQEAISYRGFTDSLVAANPSLSWTLAKSFSLKGQNYTGVATGSRVKPVNEEVILSDCIEPITSTHKTTLVSKYSLSFTDENLLVANIHGINFVTNRVYQKQIDQLVNRIKEHQGPMIVAGDFNTWNAGRMKYLMQVFSPLGLTLGRAPRIGRMDLDHIFVRGLKVNAITKLANIQSSDHLPITVDLQFEKPVPQSR